MGISGNGTHGTERKSGRLTKIHFREVLSVPLIHVNGIEIHYHMQGKGTPIVFLHPPCIGSRVFTYIRNDLSEDHKTVLFDFRGHGRSGSSHAPITIPLLAEDVRQLMDRLDISKAYLCSYSMSSVVALQALLSYPDRFLGGICIGGTAEITGWKTRAKLKAGIWAGKLRARDLISVPLAWVHADNRETFYRIRGETRSGDIENWRQYMESGLSYSAVSRLKNIHQPMLLMCGQKDNEFKGYMKVLQNGLTNFSSAYIPGLKHTLPIYGAEPIGELVRGWLNAQQRQREDFQPAAKREEEHRVAFTALPSDQQDLDAQEPYYH
jgi:pimeloyl-ACP methyl ester carboxylesterase